MNLPYNYGTFTTACDFCNTTVRFTKVSYYPDGQGASWLVSEDLGAGSDHLAIWCKDCGKEHRPDF